MKNFNLTTMEPSSERSSLTVELVGEEGQRLPVKSALLAIEEPAIRIVESSRGLDTNDNTLASIDVTLAIVDGLGDLDLSRLRARLPGKETPLFALLGQKSPAAMRKALQEGADELLFLPLEVGYITRALLNISETRRRGKSDREGLVCSLVSTSGGVGVTTLTANLALALRTKLNRSVALVDLQLQTGQLAVCLDLTPAQSIATLGNTTRRIDSTALSAVLTRHESDVYLLAAPPAIEQSDLVTEEVINSALQVLRKLFDVVLVDCGSYIDGKSVSVWERSDQLLYVVDQSIRSVRAAGRFLDLLRRLDQPDLHPAVIVNKHMSDHPVRTQYIAEALRLPIFAEIPSDDEGLREVEVCGENLWKAPNGSEFTQVIEDVARRLAGVPLTVSAEPADGWVSGLLPGRWQWLKSFATNPQ
jgi:pilus assembly protein CpaE